MGFLAELSRQQNPAVLHDLSSPLNIIGLIVFSLLVIFAASCCLESAKGDGTCLAYNIIKAMRKKK